jgi:2-polyprenyl-3-methyl-5-hydroxy-6-metoxy-1,4-benzoquinol methylase/spore coat polysaccharide biosynthesis predicted glycosyltransferase SpsG
MGRGIILTVPCFEKGRGGGHLSRCITLTNDLRLRGRTVYLFLAAQNEEREAQLSYLFSTMNFNQSWRITENSIGEICEKKIELVVLDRFQTPAQELLYWQKIAPVAGIDEGGYCRDNFDFLIDILIPESLGIPRANIASPSLLHFPPRREHKVSDVLKVLVTFGQEDSAGLGIAVARILCAQKNMDITLLRGALSQGEMPYSVQESTDKLHILENIPNLASHLYEYDVVITHYGITAYEAQYMGCTVLLASPTPYHKKLAKAAGFTCIDIKRRKQLIKKIFTASRQDCPKEIFTMQLNNLSALIDSFNPQVNRNCPVCGTISANKSIARFTDRTYRRCLCGIIFMDRSCPPSVSYEREYFFDAYKRQYGKTYLEDFPAIKASGKKRLAIIKSLLRGRGNLLDIGCAYGPFLAAARDEGFTVAGIDPAQDAVRYVQETLGITAIQGYFPDISQSSPYSVITLWYVIEHFTGCGKALAAINTMLEPGGLLAFSSPNYSGISGCSNLRTFLKNSPADHYTIWSRGSCKKALSFAGFTVKKIIVSGHHPERFPLIGRFAKSKKSPFYWLLLLISKLLHLGDTFEVYARKN